MSRHAERIWTGVFVAAALFNFLIAASLLFARHWAFAIAFYSDGAPGIAADLWADFGFCVALIGLGYLIVAFDVTKNQALVWLGILAKGFDVIVLTWRWIDGITRPLVLVPAAIDA